jgi:hypothetical protein
MAKPDDEASLGDLRDARDALADAIETLKKAMRCRQHSVRDEFVFKVGFAYGRLRKIIARDQGGWGNQIEPQHAEAQWRDHTGESDL